MKKFALVITALLVMTLVGACSSSDDSDDESSSTGSSDDNAELVDAFLDDPGAEGIGQDDAECFIQAMIDGLGLEETQAYVDDPDGWAGDQVDAAIAAGDTEGTPAIDQLGEALSTCGIDAGMDDIDVDVDVDVDDTGVDVEGTVAEETVPE